MSTTLYRKYRPQTWDEIVDQNHVKITLQHEIEQGTLAHAYLFAGPRGLGKTTTARIFAKALNCGKKKKGSATPCTTCDVCVAIRDGHALDLIEIDAASNTGVDNVRENIIASSRVNPVQFPYKIFLIDEAHMLSLSAFNALLKTLEEPPPRVIFILATTEIHKIPDTILSRCQRFDFHTVPMNAMQERLRDLASREGVRVDQEVLERIAETAEGSMRDAESILGAVLALGEKHIRGETASLVLPRTDTNAARACLTAVVRSDVGAVLASIDDLDMSGGDPVHFLQTLVRLAQQLLRRLLVGNKTDTTLEPLIPEVTPKFMLHVLDILLVAEEGVRHSQLPLLHLEVAVLNAMDVSRVMSTPVALRGQPVTEKHPLQKKPDGEHMSATSPVVRATLDDMQARWQDLVVCVEQTHRALAVILRVGYPIAIEDGILSIGFPYDFHRERLEEPAMRAIVASALQTIFGDPIAFRVVKVREAAIPKKKEDALVAEILQTFGGEVV